MLIGLISDTHGLVRPDIAAAFAGVELILHAGDVGSRDVISELELIAPVEAVAGNVDPFELGLPPSLVLDLGGLSVRVTHGHELGSPTPDKLARKYHEDIVVFGHTHRSAISRPERRLIINPGAAGPRRFNLLPGVARLHIEQRSARVEMVPLAV